MRLMARNIYNKSLVIYYNKYYLFFKIHSNILKTHFPIQNHSITKKSVKTKIEKIQLKKNIQTK